MGRPCVRSLAHRSRQFAGLPQKTGPDAGRLIGVVFKAVVPIGVFKPDLEHGVAGERQPVAAGRQVDHAVPGGVAAGATNEHPRCQLVLRLERPLFGCGTRSTTGRRQSASGNPGGMETREKSGDAQNPASAAATGSAGPDAAGPSPRRRAARQRGPCACGSAPRRSRTRGRCRQPPVAGPPPGPRQVQVRVVP